MSISISESMTTATVRDHLNSTWLPTAVCCVGVVVTGLSFENSVLSLSIVAALCIGLLSYGTSTCGSRIKAAKLLLFNSGLLALIFVLLRLALTKVGWHFPPVFWPWLHRIFRVWWLSECSAIILALIAVGLVAIEGAGKIGGDTTRKRFQWCVIAAASILVVVNIAKFSATRLVCRLFLSLRTAIHTFHGGRVCRGPGSLLTFRIPVSIGSWATKRRWLRRANPT